MLKGFNRVREKLGKGELFRLALNEEVYREFSSIQLPHETGQDTLVRLIENYPLLVKLVRVLDQTLEETMKEKNPTPGDLITSFSKFVPVKLRYLNQIIIAEMRERQEGK